LRLCTHKPRRSRRLLGDARGAAATAIAGGWRGGGGAAHAHRRLRV